MRNARARRERLQIAKEERRRAARAEARAVLEEIFADIAAGRPAPALPPCSVGLGGNVRGRS